MLLAYTDGEQNGIGLIDLRDPAKPISLYTSPRLLKLA